MCHNWGFNSLGPRFIWKFSSRGMAADITASTVFSNLYVALQRWLRLLYSRGYAPIVIRNDCYPRQEGVGFKGWGDTEVATRRE